eukprot:CAMPEP_0174937914 /NCGR_PEP_ID=MMETSP1355-20121228/61945_1 /TAXON_ID=464990 /ORGANISM="Hemiselmis tepida, Strain CCMP443" /LENGTH=66 /DNA_ID=CAMNT_0016184795 /DNA_START=8 /DNA_END=208 /DNA_ORIENTATION=+
MSSAARHGGEHGGKRGPRRGLEKAPWGWGVGAVAARPAAVAAPSSDHCCLSASHRISRASDRVPDP